MIKEKQIKTCQNCKYFQRYYVISHTSLISTNKGFCINLDMNVKLSAKHIQKNESCDLWQPYELAQLQRQYNTEQLLININKKIEDLLAILRDAE